MFVKRTGAMKPRDAVPYFREHPDLWLDLCNGKEVEIPDEVFGECTGIEKVARKSKKEKLELESFTKDGEE